MEIPWPIEDQTKVKLQLLKNYTSPWMSILFSTQERYGLPEKLIYFDGFSGPGLYWTDKSKSSQLSGSPLIVAEIANKYLKAKPNRAINIICIDKNKKCVDLLNKNLQKINKFNQKWKAYWAEFDDSVNSLLDNLETSTKLPPIFFFIDPCGYSGFPIKTLKRILKHPQSELFINFMIYDVIRFCREKQFEEKMFNLFGCTTFKEVISCHSSHARQAFIINLYCESLKNYAEAQYVMPFRINTPGQSTRPKYYLVHVSSHIKALKVMKDSMAKTSDLPYRFEAIGIMTKQMGFFEDPDKVDLRKRIENFCKNNHPQINDYDFLEEWAYANTNGISKTIKEALLILEKDNILEIIRKVRQRSNTVTTGAKIKYLE